MAPKKGEKGASKKKSKSARPPWMSEEMFALSSNLPKLSEIWSGDVKDNSSSKKNADALPIPTITRVQAGLFIWQILFPSHKAAKEKRVESIKMGVVETSVKVLASGKAPDMTPAVGILTAMTQESEQCRTAMLEAKPALLPQLLKALEMDSASLKAAVSSLLRVLATSDDTRLRLWRALREWDWTPLLSTLQLQEMSQLGGRNAALDAMLSVEALCSAKENEVANAACTNVHKYGGVSAVVEVLQNRISHPMAKAAGISILNNIMRRAPASLCEEIIITNGGLAPVVSIFAHDIVPLLRKAHAAAILLRYILPDSLWKDSSVLTGHSGRPRGLSVAAAPGGMRPSSVGLETLPALGAVADAGVPTASGSGALSAPMQPSLVEAGGTLPTGPPDSRGTGGGHAGLTGGDTGPSQPDSTLLDETTKREIVARARQVAEAGAIPWLVRLCAGPDGPLPDLSAPKATEEATAAAASAAGMDADAAASAATAAAAAGGKKGTKKAKKKGKKKKGKLEAGMAEAQAWATAVLRLVSMGEELRPTVMSAGALRYLVPLLDSRVGPTRWNVRQTLVNLSMSPLLMPVLTLYKVPEYLSGANMPDSHFMRLGASPDMGAALTKKPPPLKPIRNIDGGPSRTNRSGVPSEVDSGL